jgi:carboxylesterase type B
MFQTSTLLADLRAYLSISVGVAIDLCEIHKCRRSKDVFRRWTDFVSQMFFVCPLQIAMSALATTSPVFGYEFDDQTPNQLLSPIQNMHGIDLLYLWGQNNGPVPILFSCDDGPSCKLRNLMRQ